MLRRNCFALALFLHALLVSACFLNATCLRPPSMTCCPLAAGTSSPKQWRRTPRYHGRRKTDFTACAPYCWYWVFEIAWCVHCGVHTVHSCVRHFFPFLRQVFIWMKQACTIVQRLVQQFADSFEAEPLTGLTNHVREHPQQVRAAKSVRIQPNLYRSPLLQSALPYRCLDATTSGGGPAHSLVYMRASERKARPSPARSRLPASQLSGLSGSG